MIIFILQFLAILSFSSENDSLTNRYISRANSKIFVNTHINSKINEIIKISNKKELNCNVNKTMKIARKVLVAGADGAFIFSPMQRLIDSDFERLGMNRVLMKNSIYKYVKKRNAPILKLFSLSPTMKIDDFIVGSDKFSHFFNLGWEYYNKLQKGQDLVEVLKYSKNLEQNFWGGPTTGVVSYSDLMANFQGLRFFGHFSSKGIDPLTNINNLEYSYLTCVNRKWVKSRLFDITEYFSSSIDEGINCNVFHSTKIERAVERSVLELEQDGKNYTCPIRVSDCTKLRDVYADLSEYLLSPTCL
jgi:hypothetical protein